MSQFPCAVYILHTRDYRETSLIIHLFSRNDGRIDAVLNGGKSKKWRGIAREFCPLLAEWGGRSDLKTLIQLEQASTPHPMVSTALFAGLYVNELLVRLLPSHEPHPNLFDQYCLCLDQLSNGAELEPVLRQFEIALLDELGYQLDFVADANGQPIETAQYYRYSHQLGFVGCAAQEEGAFTGGDLIAIGAAQWHNGDTLRTAKRLMRRALHPLLGEKPLKSRGLFTHGASE